MLTGMVANEQTTTTDKERNEFTQRCLLSMADDVTKAIEHANRVQTMFWALAHSHGIKAAA